MNVDTELIKSCLKRDKKAQFLLYKKCYGFLMGICLRYYNNQDDAKAALNSGFLKVLIKLDKYKPEIPFGLWIRRIMINTIIDEFRKNKNLTATMEYRDVGDHEMVDNMDYNEVDKKITAEQLESFIHQLPKVTAQVFNLYAIDGYNHKEIGNMMGMSDGTSKWHVSSARQKLKEMINEHLGLRNVKQV